jgi:DNA-binding MarR family transcriptional regulator
MTGLPLIAQARADLELVGWRLNVLLTLAHELLDVHEYRRVKIDVLAHVAGCHRAHAARALDALVERGYVDRRQGPDGREYRLFWTRSVAPMRPADTTDSPRPAA